LLFHYLLYTEGILWEGILSVYAWHSSIIYIQQPSGIMLFLEAFCLILFQCIRCERVDLYGPEEFSETKLNSYNESKSGLLLSRSVVDSAGGFDTCFLVKVTVLGL
jgi:hypothetical protein